MVSIVDANDPDADRLVSSKPELRSLIAKVINHTVDLLYHRFGKDFYFCPDLDCRYLGASYRESRLENRRFAGNDFPEGPVTASCVNASAAIPEVDNTLPVPDTRDQLGRTVNSKKILIEL